jgi:hypothetical protein
VPSVEEHAQVQQMRHALALTLALTSLPGLAPAQAVWTQLSPVNPPPVGGPMACFEPTNEIVMIGSDGQAWRLTGNTWSAFPAPPVTLSAPGFVYDSVRQRLVLFGGYLGPANTPSNDLWEWDGAQWANPNPSVRPSPRGSFGMAFDRVRGVTVVFGGNNSGNLGDLWEWDGQQWTQRVIGNALHARNSVLMAFDPVNRSVLLHGGLELVQSFPFPFTIPHNDTWSWDGVVLTQRTPAPSPSPAVAIPAALVSDLRRARVLRYAGGTAPHAIEWNGTQWVQLAAVTPGPVQLGLAFDTAARRVIAAGAAQGASSLNLLWEYGTPLLADVAPFGAGCAGSAGTPALANAPYVYPWLGDTMRSVVQPLPGGGLGAIFVSSFGTTPPVPLAPVGAPGCDLLVLPDVADLRLASGNRAEWSLAIPNVPALAAQTFRQQAFVIDPAANALGLVASNAVSVTLGVR